MDGWKTIDPLILLGETVTFSGSMLNFQVGNLFFLKGETISEQVFEPKVDVS